MLRRTVPALLAFTLSVVCASMVGCTNKPVLGDRPGYQEVEAVNAISEARRAVQWVEIDLDGYQPTTPDAVRDRDAVLVQWARVRDRAEELQARLSGMSDERWSGRDPQFTTDFYQTSEQRAAVLRQETSRLLDLWTRLNETYRTQDEGIGSRSRRQP